MTKRSVVGLLVASALAGVGVAAAAGPDSRESFPLPAGGNFNGIRWPQDETLEPPVVEATQAYNAACQWLRAWRDGRDDRALAMLADIPSWPAIEAAGSAPVLALVAKEAAAGGGETVAGVLAACDASHAREVSYARAQRLTPSS
ncbi:hypothetical protein OJ998_25015 [Solirubrobacter taibaiensis]|nr:hypothetical protein [Solirubrobacter taibaiensis]